MKPLVSVVIPAYHSNKTIARCLEALTAQTLQDLEIIVVNSSPEQQTRQIIQTQFPTVIFEQSQTRLFPHAARNVGVANARGEFFAFTDPDCIARPNWLEHLIRACGEGKRIVQGSMEIYQGGWFARGVHLCKWFSLLSGLSPHALTMVSSGNACYPRIAWQAAGPFDADLFCGDALLSWRAAACGYQLWFEPRAVVEHIHSQDLNSLWKERLARGREFAPTRMQHENWSRWRAAGYAVALPMVLAFLLTHAGINALRSHWFTRFVCTLPIQIVGQLAWLIGEAPMQIQYAVRFRGR